MKMLMFLLAACNMDQEVHDPAVNMQRACSVCCNVHNINNAAEVRDSLDNFCFTDCRDYLDCFLRDDEDEGNKMTSPPRFVLDDVISDGNEEQSIHTSSLLITIIIVVTVLISLLSIASAAFYVRRIIRKKPKGMNEMTPIDRATVINSDKEEPSYDSILYEDTPQFSAKSDSLIVMHDRDARAHSLHYSLNRTTHATSSNRSVRSNCDNRHVQTDNTVNTSPSISNTCMHQDGRSASDSSDTLSRISMRIHSMSIGSSLYHTNSCSGQPLSHSLTSDTDMNYPSLRVWNEIPHGIIQQLQRISDVYNAELIGSHLLITVVGNSVDAARRAINSETELEDDDYLIRLIVQPPSCVLANRSIMGVQQGRCA